MRGTCPSCGEQSHISAFFVESEGKRLAITVADMEPVLGRAVIAYLGLFKPVKTQLRLARAAKIAQEIADLVSEGSVCKDERNGVRRPASATLWAAGIETMLVQRGTLTLPLENHNYLRSVVFSLADKADAAVERKTEKAKQHGQHLKPVHTNNSETPLERELNWINQQRSVGAISPEQAEVDSIAMRRKFGENA